MGLRRRWLAARLDSVKTWEDFRGLAREFRIPRRGGLLCCQKRVLRRFRGEGWGFSGLKGLYLLSLLSFGAHFGRSYVLICRGFAHLWDTFVRRIPGTLKVSLLGVNYENRAAFGGLD